MVSFVPPPTFRGGGGGGGCSGGGFGATFGASAAENGFTPPPAKASGFKRPAPEPVVEETWAGADETAWDMSMLDIETLRQQIKQLQRSDPAAKEQWIAYCDNFGNGKCDPGKHDETFIASFLSQYQSGARIEGGNENIILVTKMLQRKSPNFKNSWAQFCALHGGGKNDPAVHPAEYHVAFYDDVCAQAQGYGGSVAAAASMGGGMAGMAGMAGVAGMGGGMAGGMTAGAAGGFMPPPAKQMKMSAPGMGGCMGAGMGAGMGMGMSMGMTAGMIPGGHAELVTQVKSFQRMGEAQKQAWWDYADTNLGGIRDPAKHDSGTLQQFISDYGVGPALLTMPQGAPLSMAMDSEKAAYVNRIKAYQRADPSQKEAWYEFCDQLGDVTHSKNPTKDPARHETSTLADFITRYGVP